MLNSDDIFAIHRAAIAANLASERSALLSGLDPGFVATLTKASNHAAQLLTNLNEMNSVASLRDGTVPLAVWLDHAIQLASMRPEVAVFQAARAKLPGRPVAVYGPAAPAQSPAPPPITRAADLAARATVGIITALPKEFTAAKAMLDDPVEHAVEGRGVGREYVLGEVPAKGGGAHAVALALAGVGNNQATARATLLLEHFDAIDAILMVGIAGGVPHPTKPEHHVRLGDVVVSDRGGVVKYDFDKETLDTLGAVHIEHRHPPRPPGARLLEAVRDLDAKEIENDFPWERHLARAGGLQGAGRPAAVDELRDTADPTRVLLHPEDSARRPGLPRIFKGPIASADKLLKNPLKRDMLRDRFGVKAIEMEGSGIADATWNFEVGYLVVRGVCDFCDGQKDDAWQMYAAIIAAAYARAVLERMRVRSPSRRA